MAAGTLKQQRQAELAFMLRRVMGSSVSPHHYRYCYYSAQLGVDTSRELSIALDLYKSQQKLLELLLRAELKRKLTNG